MMKGTAMGSSMCPSYANIFMYQLEKEIVEELTENNIILLYKRYIDDTLIIINGSEETVAHTIERLNKMDESIKFTYNTSNKKVDFLDIISHSRSSVNEPQKKKDTSRTYGAAYVCRPAADAIISC